MRRPTASDKPVAHVAINSDAESVQDEFTDEQFEAVMAEGREVFAKMAAEARKSAHDGTVRKFPA